MPHQHTAPEMPQRTENLGPDNESDRDSGVGEDAGEDADSCPEHSATEDDVIKPEDMDENGGSQEDFTVFVSFQGDMDDEDFSHKLNMVLSGIPNILDMDSERLQPQHVEPWNSVRVTFNIPRDAAERLRLLAQNNQQQLRDLGILSVQIEGEGAINVAMGPNRGAEVRVNGPMVAPGQMRMDGGFPGQPGPGGLRMPNPAMVPPGPGMVGQNMLPGSSGPLHPRIQRPPSQTDVMDPMMPGMSIQQQQQQQQHFQHQQPGLHGSVSMPPQAAHHMQALQAGRQLNPAALQQLQQQQAQQQVQLSQLGPRPPFNPSGQMPAPPNWNQLPSGILPPPPTAQGSPAWRKHPPQPQMVQRPPSLGTVLTPSHPPPPYPFGSQQAGQVFNAMGQGQLQQQHQPGMGQFAAPQPKGQQAGPGSVTGLPRPPPPLPQTSGPQGNLAAKSPGSSSSPFQQGSPGTPPMMAQRPTTPQGFPQGVGSPGRAALNQQGNMQQGFIGMPQHGQPGAQIHPGMAKRPMGFPTSNFVQGQVSVSTPGTPVGGATQQLQTNQAMSQAGPQPSPSTPSSMQGPPHVQPNVMGVQSSMAGPTPCTTAGPSMGQQQPGLQTQMMGLQHQAQPVSSSPSQMVQGQGGGQTVLSRPINQGPRGGMTPPKQMMPQQGQGVMHGQGQMVGGQGHQAMLLQQQQQNLMMEQMVANQMQGNKQTFGGKIPAGVMPGQMMRGPSANIPGNMGQFQGQVAPQQMTPQQQQQMAQLQQQQLQQQHQLQQHQLQQQQQQHHQQISQQQQPQQAPVPNNPNQTMGLHGQQMRLPAGHHLIQQQLQQQQQQQLQQQQQQQQQKQQQQAMLQQQQAAQQHQHTIGDPSGGTGDLGVQQMVPDMQAQQQQGMMGGPQHMQMGNGHFAGHGMNFNSQFPGQMPIGGSCGQPGSFPVNKDVTLTSPLLVNLLQSDISASQFGPGGKQGAGGGNPAKPKKKKPPRKKKPKEGDGQQQVEGLGGLDAATGMEDSELPNLGVDQGLGLDNSGQKLPDFANRPPGFPGQPGEQRVLQQAPMQFIQQQQQQQQMQHMQMQHQMQQQQLQQQQQQQQQQIQQQMQQQQPMMQMQGLQNAQGSQMMTGPQPSGQVQPQMHPHQLQQQQQQQQSQQPHLQQQQQQQMMLIKMQQEQSKNRMPISTGGQLPPRGMANPGDIQRHPGSQQGNMPVMISLQGHGSVPPSPDKPRGMPLMVNPQLTGAARRMSHPDLGPGAQSSGSEEATVGAHSKQDRQGGSEMGLQPGNGSQQIPTSQVSNTHMMKQGPGSTQMPQLTGASPQQQLPTLPQQAGHMPGHHFPNVPTTSQSSRPKTPNRASPRPYHHPLTPSNRPPSTEPSEINLSPERLNASIAGLFPPKINIPLPPRQPNLNRGFDQQGLNPTTLKAIGQAPPTLTLTGNNGNGSSGGNNTNNQQSLSSGAGVSGTKQEKISGGQSKRASPSNSRRSSPASSRKSATPSPGRQKGAKMSITCPPHQQQLANPQGQAMILSPSSVPPSPVSMLSQVSGSTEAQQMQSTLQGSHGNPVDGVRENQATPTTEQQHITQPQSQSLRDLSASRMTIVHATRQPKADSEGQTGTVERPLTQLVPTHNPDSSTFRTAPTSLNQLLDNTAVSNKPLRPSQSGTPAGGKHSPKPTLESDVSLHSNSQSTERSMTTTTTTTTANETEQNPKLLVQVPTCNPNLQQLTSVPSSHSANNVNTNTILSFTQTPNSSLVHPNSNINTTPSHCNSVSTNTNATTGTSPSTVTSSHNMSTNTSSNSSTALNLPSSAHKPSQSPKPVSNIHSVIQIPASSTTISSNQITVFVTSNPNTSAPTSMVSTMMAAANKNTRPQDIRQQSPGPRPQFITTTPVFINPIFQVPGSSVAPNTSVVSQSVTMVGSIQVPTGSIQLSPALSSTQPSGVKISTSQPNRTVAGQVQVATNAATAVGALTSSHQPNPGTTKAESQNETALSQKSVPAVWKPPPHSSATTSSPFQTPLSSPPCSSSGTVSSFRKSPISPSPTQAKGKSVPAAVSSTGESLQSFMGAAPPQVFLPPASLATQTEARSLSTTASTTNNPLSVVSSPVPVSAQTSVPNQILGSASMLPTASLPNSTANSQSPMPTVVGTSSGVSSAALQSTVTLVQSTVPSVVPIVATPGSAEATHASPVADPSRVLPVQSDPPTAEPSSSQPAVSGPEATRILPALQQEVLQERASSEKMGNEATAGSEQPWAKKRKTPINLVPRAAVEKPKGPSRRSSRAEKEVDEEPVADSSSRKRSARPQTSTAAKETAASPTQAKRRKSK